MNRSLEHLGLRFNNVCSRTTAEIDAKTDYNSSELRRRKVPEYKRAIQNLMVGSELADKLDWEADQLRQQTDLISGEIRNGSREFERVRCEEDSKYIRLKEEYDRAIEQERSLDRQMLDFDVASREIARKAECCIKQTSARAQLVGDAILRMEADCIFGC